MNFFYYFKYNVKLLTDAPWNKKLYKMFSNVKELNKINKYEFESYFMRSMFFWKISRPNIDSSVSLLSIRTYKPKKASVIKCKRLFFY